MCHLSTVFCFALCFLAASAVRSGYNPEIREVRYMVSVQKVQEDGKTKHICGGSIIAPAWILTSAECLHRITANEIEIVAGTADITNEEPEAQRRKVVEIIRHPDFDYFKSRNDIALLKLDSPLTFGDDVHAVKLDRDGLNQTRSVLVVGWGNIKSYTNSEVKSTTQNVISFTKCRSLYHGYGDPFGFLTPIENSIIKEEMFCAAADNGYGSARKYDVRVCETDAGGPAISTKTRKQVGIISTRLRCETGDFPAVYTNVAMFIPWVQELTGLSF